MENKQSNKLSKRIKELRLKHHLSQDELAHKTDVSYNLCGGKNCQSVKHIFG